MFVCYNKFGDDMFIRKIVFQFENVNQNKYPYNIEGFQHLKEVEFHKPVSFFIGENGSGKSTLIEALAILCGMNKEGGSQNYMFDTKNTVSDLYKNCKLIKGIERPKTKYFLRAESFYNTCSYIDSNPDALQAFGFASLHECSHGESFIKLIEDRFYDHGLYILDEPEAALSPIRQMRLLFLIDKLVKQGSQFIIATHSPILLAYQNATIYDFNQHMANVDYKDTEIYQIYKLFLNEPERMLSELFQE